MPRSAKATIIKGLGAKFGTPVRKRYGRLAHLQRKYRICPSCGSVSLKRKASGIWACLKCDFRIAGEAYDIKTS